MNLKLIFGIIVPLVVVISLVLLSSTNIGFSVEKETEKSVKFENLFREQGSGKDNIQIQTITIENDFFIPKKFELPQLIACLNDKDGVRYRSSLYLKYSEGKYSYGSDIPLFSDILNIYSYSSSQGIDIPANSKKQIKITVEPIYVYSYDQINTFDSYKNYDEVLLIYLKDNKRYVYCDTLDAKGLENAIHINITDKPTLTEGFTKQPTCRDSDYGKNYYAKGQITTTNPYFEASDHCVKDLSGLETGELIEYFCTSPTSSDNSIGYRCPNGCKDGACVLAPPKFGNVTINSPNGGETLAKGMSHSIEWTSSGFGIDAEAQIQLRDSLNSEKMVKLITLSIPNTGRYSWTVPNDIPEGKYLLWITVMSGNDILGSRVLGTDYSDSAFSISSR